jgi:hypothetical protein
MKSDSKSVPNASQLSFLIPPPRPESIRKPPARSECCSLKEEKCNTSLELGLSFKGMPGLGEASKTQNPPGSKIGIFRTRSCKRRGALGWDQNAGETLIGTFLILSENGFIKRTQNL